MLTHSLKNKKIRYLFSCIAVVISALLQAYVIQVFITPSNLLSSGFTGVAILIDKIAALYGCHISTSVAILMLNIPVALICFKSISKKFTILSTIQFVLASVFLSFCRFQPLFHDLVLNVIFGGFLYGLCVVIALKGSASTGGTDFIALYVSNKIGRSIWEQVFIFNALILCIFSSCLDGCTQDTPLFFSLSQQKRFSFHHRYERVTMQITTTIPELVIDMYVDHYRHGISCIQGYGGFSKKKMYLLHSNHFPHMKLRILRICCERQIRVINVLNTEGVLRKLYMAPME